MGSRIIGAVVASLMELLFWHLSRVRTVVDADGVRVFGFLRQISLPWPAVEGLTLTNALRVRVADGRIVGIPGFMGGPRRPQHWLAVPAPCAAKSIRAGAVADRSLSPRVIAAVCAHR